MGCFASTEGCYLALTCLGPGSRHREREPQDRNAFPSSDTGVVFLRVALWWLRQDTWPIDDALLDEKLSEYLTKLMLYYIDHGAKMSIRFPRAEEANRWSGRGAILHTSPTVEYHGGAANIVANYVSHFGNPQIFQVSIPLISFSGDDSLDGFLYFYLEETWHRYLALSMPMCIVSSDGICRKRKENTGDRATACCEFYNYFSLGSESPNKEKLGGEFARAAIENMKRRGMLANMKEWSRIERLLLRLTHRA